MIDNWTWMTGYGFGHWLFLVVMVAVISISYRAHPQSSRLSPFWSLLTFISLVNLISLWALAFSDWPAEKSKGGA